MQYEAKAFRRRQPVEHDEQCEPDRICQERFTLRCSRPSLSRPAGASEVKAYSRRDWRDRSTSRRTRATTGSAIRRDCRCSWHRRG
jgi:hypothetical protein